CGTTGHSWTWFASFLADRLGAGLYPYDAWPCLRSTPARHLLLAGNVSRRGALACALAALRCTVTQLIPDRLVGRAVPAVETLPPAISTAGRSNRSQRARQRCPGGGIASPHQAFPRHDPSRHRHCRRARASLTRIAAPPRTPSPTTDNAHSRS